MSLQAQVAALKQHLEQLFPGKWLTGKENQKALLTGISEIDNVLSRGLARQRITEWTGQASSGKTTLLRTVVTNWCTAGLDVAYVDAGSKLLAADWFSVDQGRGRFWVIRATSQQKQAAACTEPTAHTAASGGATQEKVVNLSSRSVIVGQAREPPGSNTPSALRSDISVLNKGEGDASALRRNTSDERNAIYHDQSFRRAAKTGGNSSIGASKSEPELELEPVPPAPAVRKVDQQTYLYSADQLIRCNAFDVVILDLGSISSLSSRVYARLQQSLARSKAALIVMRDGNPAPPGWGCHTQLGFRWGKTSLQAGLSGIAAIVPSIEASVWRDGLSKNVEITAGSHVSNRLFTHPPVPDRRTPKA
jgi:hypothetical protein